ncbi:putative ribonuclease H-like domain-containing protein [Tanacetum coccineum]
MEARTPSTTLTAKLPILNPGDYDLWLIRIEQYFLMTDYSLWEVILNGNKVLKRKVGETEQEYEPTTAEEKQDRRNEMKARGTLLMVLPNKDQLKFHSYKDAKLLMEAIEKRLQKLITQLEIQGEVITQENMNLKLLRSLPSIWKNHALIWRNKQEIETISLDDLYNNLKIYELEISGSSSTSQNLQNVAFVSSKHITAIVDTNGEADNSTYVVSAAHNQSCHTSGETLMKMDLQWEMAMLAIRARRFIKRTCRKLDVNGQRVGFDRSRVECYNYHKYGHFARECRAPRNQENKGREIKDDCDIRKLPLLYKAGLESIEARLAHYKKNDAVFEESINVLKVKVKLKDTALVENKKKLEKAEKERDELKQTLKNLFLLQASPAVESFVNSSKMLENQENNKSKSDKGYHAIPPPFTGNFMPRKPDLTFMDEIVKSENLDVTTVVTPSNVKAVESNHESAM